MNRRASSDIDARAPKRDRRRADDSRSASHGRHERIDRRQATAWLGGVALSGLAAGALIACPQAADARAPATPDTMPDATLVDAQGRRVRWRSDVLRDHISVVNFIYTGCTSLCPTTSAVMAELQHRLRSRAALRFVSLSLDPLSDTPQRLSDFARPFAPGPQWWWLTGEPSTVFQLLDALQANAGADPASHVPTWLVGRAGHGPWRRLLEVPAIAHFQKAVDDLQ